jgi:LacI family transcriptional regulator
MSSVSLHLIETPYGIDNGIHAFHKLMSEPQRPTVVMCGNDVLTIGTLKGANSLGIRVPKDVSITGFDDIELAPIADPELTTVHVPHREMGKQAAQMLVDMVNGTPPTKSMELMTRVCIRRSLGQPTPIAS